MPGNQDWTRDFISDIDMGQPTPPSPAASTDELVSRKHMADNAYLNPTSPGEHIESYSQGQSPYNPLVPETYAQFGYLQPSQDMVFSTYPPLFYGSSAGEACHSAFSRYTPETSPPAHPQTTDAIAARSRQGMPKTSTPTKYRTTKERRAEKKNKDAKRRDPSNSIGKPLSEIALEVPNIFVPDATAFSARPVEIRREEAVEAGKIKRPLNAFMLYRRSYQNVAKTRCTRNNHQQVSAVCGESWSSWEPPDVVSEFNRLAGIEKQMHEQAFPDYKYDPILAKKPGDDGDVVPSLASDTSDPEYGGRRKVAKRNARKRSARSAQLLNEPPQLGYDAVEMGPPLPGVQNAGCYWPSPALRPLPTPYDGEHLGYMNHGLYGDPVTGSMGGHMISRSPSPMTNCLEQGLMGHNSMGFMETSIDPSLLPGPTGMTYDGMLHNSMPVDMQGGWCRPADGRQDMGVMMPDLDGGGSYNAYLKGNEQDWEVEQLDEARQFDDWISQTEGVGM